MVKGMAFIEANGAFSTKDIKAIIRGYEMKLKFTQEELETVFKSITSDKFG